MADTELSAAARCALLEMAYRTLVEYLQARQIPEPPTAFPELDQPAGAFVTLNVRGHLRGCIGHVQAEMPLWEVVQQMTLAAAEHDPRFLPLTPADLDDLEIEISVLSPPERIDSIEKVETGKHGLIVAKGRRRGLLLPQVAPEHHWDRYTFAEAVCDKANLPPGSWRQGANLFTFTAQVFGSHYGRNAPTSGETEPSQNAL